MEGLAGCHMRGSTFEALILDQLYMQPQGEVLEEVVVVGQMKDLELEALILDQPCMLVQVGLPFLI